ncbi:MAG: hypothetical protein HWD59_02980 [Coxiellaceae bacterium]|nr:MAG: hypothetical protein HWD59_02980 [Coxiellaceae bacterium]
MKLIARLMNAYTNLGLTDIEKEFTELFESWLHENNTALSPSLLANIKDFAQLYWHIFNIQMVPAKGMIINFIYHFDEENSIEPESIQTKIYTVNSQQKVSVKSIINFNQEDNFLILKKIGLLKMIV